MLTRSTAGFVRAPEYDFGSGGGELVKAYRLSLNRATAIWQAGEALV
jgi:hypothetical protein